MFKMCMSMYKISNKPQFYVYSDTNRVLSTEDWAMSVASIKFQRLVHRIR